MSIIAGYIGKPANTDIVAWKLSESVPCLLEPVLMAKGGKQRIGDETLKLEALKIRASGGDPCEFLRQEMEKAKKARDNKRRIDIKGVKKEFGCRRRGGGGKDRRKFFKLPKPPKASLK